MILRYKTTIELELVYRGEEIEEVLPRGSYIEINDEYIKVLTGKSKNKKYKRVSSNGDTLDFYLYKRKITVEEALKDSYYLREISPLEWMLIGEGVYYLFTEKRQYKIGDVFRFGGFQAYIPANVKVIKVEKMYSSEWMRWASIARRGLALLNMFKGIPTEIGFLGYRTTIVRHNG